MATKELWHKRQTEGREAFAAFRVYLEMGAERSQSKVAAKLGKSRQLIARWSAHHEWMLRTEAYDANQLSKREGQQDAALTADVDVWAGRQNDIREDAWEQRKQLIEKADQMLKWPHVQQKSVTGTCTCGKPNVVNYFNPAKWTFADIARIYQLADQLGRLAAELPTEYVLFSTMLTKKGIDPREVLKDMIAEFADVESQ